VLHSSQNFSFAFKYLKILNFFCPLIHNSRLKFVWSLSQAIFFFKFAKIKTSYMVQIINLNDLDIYRNKKKLEYSPQPLQSEANFALAELISYADEILNTKVYSDTAKNGLQVESSFTIPNGALIVGAVDSGLPIIEGAVALGASLLVVHHGLFWSDGPLVVGSLGRKIRELQANGCSLYASHLPLDGDLNLGNGVGLARFLGLEGIEPFFYYKGSSVGVRGRFKNIYTISAIESKLTRLIGYNQHLTLPFGSQDIFTVGIVTGSGGFAISEAAALGLDLLITGEPKQASYYEAFEAPQSVIFAGHYATETFGVISLVEDLANKFNCRSCFINNPTGI
jgi:dinuclear metal center YbgI/SA1388 family protein